MFYRFQEDHRGGGEGVARGCEHEVWENEGLKGSRRCYQRIY